MEIETLTKKTLRQVPTLSLADYTMGSTAARAQFVTQLFLGIKEYGFIILKDHGVSFELQKKAYLVLEKFYQLPTEIKKKYILQNGGGQRGYTSFGQEHAKDSPVMDLKEFWHVGREVSADHKFAKYHAPNIWPEEVPEFKEIFSELFNQLEKKGRIMLEALTGPLEIPTNFFEGMTEDGSSILRLLHYPPIPAGVDPRCVRAAAHEDINLITLLPAATASGLQLKDRDGKWLDVDGDPGTLIVDAGDMLARMTNDLIPSTTHRVINTEEGRTKSRFSMPFFMHPHPEASLACLPSCIGAGKKYSDMTAGDFLTQRLREIGLIK